MITLALQIFLLLLAAYLAGCMTGCILRRAMHTPQSVTAVATAPAAPSRLPPTPEAARFENALTGKVAAAQAAASAGEPVVEVRPRPAPASERYAGQGGTADIEIVKAPVAEPPAPTPPEPPAAEAGEQDMPPPSGGAPDIASYAAVAAAAAAAEAASAPEPEPAAATPQESQPAAAAAESAAVAPAEAPEAGAPPLPPDDLKRIRSIDRALEGRLNSLGVHRFAEIAAWTAADVARVSQSLGLLGRIEQENWIEQAHILARGSETDFSRRQRATATVATTGVAAAAASAVANVTAQSSAAPDRFTRIIGIDPETEQVLYAMGFTRYAEIARWTSADVERVEAKLGRPGRVGLDNWIEQARVLARYAGETGEARPVRLADAIRENKAREASEPPAARSDVAGLRSVRSQALRGEGPAPGERIDDLKRIRGVGVLIEKRLNALGITSYEQIANWTKADIDSVSSQLDFKGRIERENWIEQARILASGGQTEFSRRVDRGEVETSKEG